MTVRIDLISVFPEYLAPLQLSIIGRASANGLVDIGVTDLRDFTHDVHRTVDDAPFGGGPGMVMKPEPWGEALDHVLERTTATDPLIVIPSASGHRFGQQYAQDWATQEHLIFACGRYEGIDARVPQHYATRARVLEMSLGDFVLAGGEAAALAMVEACVRLIPGVLGNAESVSDDSFSPDRTGAPLEGPVYTRPREWRGLEVPPVLFSGDHGQVRQWRFEQSSARTESHRPDLPT